jgi:hypothetical protein
MSTVKKSGHGGQNPMKTISVRLPEELARAARVHAAMQGTTLQPIVIRALEALLNKEAK